MKSVYRDSFLSDWSLLSWNAEIVHIYSHTSRLNFSTTLFSTLKYAKKIIDIVFWMTFRSLNYCKIEKKRISCKYKKKYDMKIIFCFKEVDFKRWKNVFLNYLSKLKFQLPSDSKKYNQE